MSIQGCPFCNFNNTRLVVHETGLTYSIISHNPINTHHAMVIPKKHYESFSDLPDQLVSELIVHAKKLSLAIRAVCCPDGMTHVSDDDFADVGYNLVKHYKIHVFPRYSDDGIEQKWRRVQDPGDEGRAKIANSLRGVITSW
jgi:histidine triad (HIT) family protein